MQKKQHGKLYLFMGVLLAMVAVLGIFFKSVQPENEAHKEEVRLAKKYAHLKKEDAFYRYSRDKTFYTVFGTNADNQKIYAIVSKNGKKINIYGQEDGISAETAKKAVRKRQDVKKITNVGMGMKGKTPVWEVTYLNAYGNLCYDIIAFKNGDIIKTIQNI